MLPMKKLVTGGSVCLVSEEFIFAQCTRVIEFKPFHCSRSSVEGNLGFIFKMKNLHSTALLIEKRETKNIVT